MTLIECNNISLFFFFISSVSAYACVSINFIVKVYLLFNVSFLSSNYILYYIYVRVYYIKTIVNQSGSGAARGRQCCHVTLFCRAGRSAWEGRSFGAAERRVLIRLSVSSSFITEDMVLLENDAVRSIYISYSAFIRW